MSRLKLIRQRLGVTQHVLAECMETVQGNITTYEAGRSIPAKRARLLIAFAATRGLTLTFDHIYGDLPLPETAETTHA